MGRMHAPGKGISDSALPYKRTPPSWLKISASDVNEQGASPAQAGAICARLARATALACAYALSPRRQPAPFPRLLPLVPPRAVCKLAKKGLTPSQIGVILRDSNGIAQVRSVTGNKILRLLKKNGACAPRGDGGGAARRGGVYGAARRCWRRVVARGATVQALCPSHRDRGCARVALRAPPL